MASVFFGDDCYKEVWEEPDSENSPLWNSWLISDGVDLSIDVFTANYENLSIESFPDNIFKPGEGCDSGTYS